MLRSCQYCGKIHNKNYDCGKKPFRIKKRSENDTFRSSMIWRNKSEEIKERDKYLCQACFHKFVGTEKQLNYHDLSVHHIVSLEDNFDKRLDNDNLITLCRYHHEQAEKGNITINMLRSIVPPTK